ncbi:uncharacterized protein LOC135100889 isoform X1 [Scylla paramamosain]|uniref:uncharacterized protein LOC135100889 isoform X1 n=1 Tax=Scylla paramamosain TaxID=85552 RepID=UPI0030829D63
MKDCLRCSHVLFPTVQQIFGDLDGRPFTFFETSLVRPRSWLGHHLVAAEFIGLWQCSPLSAFKFVMTTILPSSNNTYHHLPASQPTSNFNLTDKDSVCVC